MLAMINRSFAVVLLFAVASNGLKDFTGDQILTLTPRTDAHVEFIKGLEDHYGVDFWSPGYGGQVRLNTKVDVHFERNSLNEFKSAIEAAGVEYKVKVSDLQILVDDQLKGRKNAKESLVHNYNVYHTLPEIDQWMLDIANTYPSLVTLENMGKSYEGRDIHMLKISTDSSNPVVFIDCTFHAREWITTAFCQCFTRNLLEGYGVDPVFTNHLNKLNFYIMPVVNVDGYVYTWKEDRMWRKTRSNYNTTCYGVDPNRNLDVNWSGEGASGNPCSSTYYGPYVESEPEAKLFADFIRQNKEDIMVYLSMHSYSQLFSLPYSYTYDHPPTLLELEKYAAQSAKAIKSVFGMHYDYGPGSDNLYLVSGGTKDYVYIQGVPFSTTLELRDNGEYGFLLPENQIEPTCIEVTAGVRTLSDAAIELWENKLKATD